MPLNLYDREGHRKYFTAGEREAFLKAAEDAPREGRTFCATLHYTGCRISEALTLTADRVDMKDRRMVFKSRVKEVMHAAGINGGHAMPKGFRHGFGVRGSVKSVPLDKLQKWLGHADLKTTDAAGAERSDCRKDVELMAHG